MKKQKKLIIIIACLLLVSLGGLFYIKTLEKPVEEEKVLVEETPVKEETSDYGEEIALWRENHGINPDYLGEIYFESGLINLPFVQGDSNDEYFRTDWATGNYDEEGSIFLDSRNDLYYDQNLIIYGHNVEASYEPSLTHKFTPLHILENKDNYEENRYIDLLLEDSICRYLIVSVYRCGIEEIDGVQYVKEDAPVFYETNYTQEEFDEYITRVKENAYYDTNVEVDCLDKLLTLQTCISGSIDKLLVLAKLEETIYID